MFSQRVESDSLVFSDVNLVQNLASAAANYDALVIVTTQLDEINGYVDVSVIESLQSYLHVCNKRWFRDDVIPISDQ